jgi:hypothetical protein
MSSAQLRLAETIDTFYSASDRTSESAMAANAYRRSVEELDAGIGRELVRCPSSLPISTIAHHHVFFYSLDRMPPIARPSSTR